MNLIELLTAPRYGIYLPQAKTTTDVEYTGYGSSFRLSMSLELGNEKTFLKVQEAITEFQDRSQAYFEARDMELVGVLLGAAMKGSSYLIGFGEHGITLAELITVDAKRIEFIYEKYNRFDYAIQLGLTRKSSIKFTWSESKLEGDFYFNLKRSVQEDVSTITGYIDKFHLGNEAGAKSLVISAGVVTRKPLKAKEGNEPTDPDKPTPKPEAIDHTYIRLQSRSSNGLTIGDIVRMVTPDSVEIPNMLDAVAIYDFAILKSSTSNSKEFAFVLDCKITLSEKELATKLTILSSEAKNGETTSHSFSFHGRVSVEEHQFDIDFSKAAVGEDTSWAILASYVNKGKINIDFKKLAAALFGERDSFPEISIHIKKPKVFFYYQKTKKAGDEKPVNKFLIGMGAGIDLDLKSLPMAGTTLVEMNALEFKEVLAMYANQPFTNEDLKPFTSNKLLPKDTEVSKGISISAEVVVNGTSNYYSFGGSKPAPQQLTEGDNATDEPKNLDPSAASQAKWLVIDKKIGPVNLQRLGLAYYEGKVVALLDASVKTKGMEMQMMGLGVGFKLDWSKPDPDFYLYGLGLSYKTGAVEISGAFLRGSQDGVETYNGAARIKLSKFTISAIGSYAKTQEGESSLFIYGLFEGNIGGPPIFYITGIAAGFGYSRKINAPEPLDIATYPLVALAMNPNKDGGLGEVLNSLETPMSNGKLPIEIAPGNYWLAVGVKFTSFKIIESFVLVTVNFGTKTEFNILGLSRMEWPEKSLRDKVNLANPIVYIELAIRVSFSTDSDVIKVDGIITPNSYVLSQNCRLTGGFAFYVWISGEHAGDFVLTIGGYHPRFQKPAHYPVVPRVALNWVMSESLALRGELYFALTSSAIMMGGRWEMHFNTKIVKATFAMWIDLLIQWAPFHYDIGIGILIDVEAHIPVKLCTIHLYLHFRAELIIWGPPFSGIAEIDLGIYSFSIRFGNKENKKPEPLRWDEFSKGFLPKAKDAPKLQNSAGLKSGLGDATATQVDCISTTVSAGVINVIEKPDEEKLYIANPMQLAIAIDSTIPVTTLHFNGNETNHKGDNNSVDRLGVKPCGYVGNDLSFKMDVTMTLKGEEVNTNIVTEKITKGFPEALWGIKKDNESKVPSTPELLTGIMSGMSIRTEPLKAHYLQKYDFSKFLDAKTYAKNDEVLLATLGEPESFYTRDVYETMKNYQHTAQQRNNIIAGLKDLGMGFGVEDDFEKLTSVEEIYGNGAAYFRAEPKLCPIGHHAFNPTDTN